MPYNTMSHVGLEDDYATVEQLKEMAASWHYGWAWHGPETGKCGCSLRPCGLLVPSSACSVNHAQRLGTAKQLHKWMDCQ